MAAEPLVDRDVVELPMLEKDFPSEEAHTEPLQPKMKEDGAPRSPKWMVFIATGVTINCSKQPMTATAEMMTM